MRRLNKVRAKRMLIRDVSDTRVWVMSFDEAESPENFRKRWAPWAQRVNAKYGREMKFALETQTDHVHDRVILTARVTPPLMVRAE